MDQVMQFLRPIGVFCKDCQMYLRRCRRPEWKEYKTIAKATAIGFALMGFIGFFVRLIHIPIVNILVDNPPRSRPD